MSKITITYATNHENSQGVATKFLEGDFVGCRTDGDYTIVGCAVKQQINIPAEGDAEGYSYEEATSKEEFYIPTRAVYHVQIEHSLPEVEKAPWKDTQPTNEMPAPSDERPLLEKPELSVVE